MELQIVDEPREQKSEMDLVKEARELLANAAQGPLTLIRYEHGGGRLYREEPRDLIADFYDAANRELYYRAPELLKTLADEVEQLRKRAKQMEREAREDARDAAAEARWQERQGEDYGSY